MFRKSKKYKQLSVLGSTNILLDDKVLKDFNNDKKWNNVFRIQVTERIDEELFRPLFCENNGAPNASIRLLIAMMILKEARGWSDSQLFENAQYNLLVRSALGLPNFDESIPAASTYYLLRKRIVDREIAGLSNLMEDVFASITKSQLLEFNIDGSKIRMDSTLMGSNIAWNTRYELIHETLRMAYKGAKKQIDKFLSEKDINILKQLSAESSENVSFRSSKAELESKLIRLGSIIYAIVKNTQNKSIKALAILHQVFSEQYEIINEVALPLPKQAIKANSIQSPHDPDCDFRQKGGTDVKGYTINVCETCDKSNDVNLITDVQVEPASHSDIEFFQPAIENTQELLPQKIETVNADGAYYSSINQDYCTENGIDFITHGIQGEEPRYLLSFDEDGVLQAFDTKTNTLRIGRKPNSNKPDSTLKWVIYDENNKRRYFTESAIINSLARQQISNRPREDLERRNNVEATIFQLCYHYLRKKSRYRGLIKHKIWAYARCLWVNFVRIMKNIIKDSPVLAQNIKRPILSWHILFINAIFEIIMRFIKIFDVAFPKLCLNVGLGKMAF